MRHQVDRIQIRVTGQLLADLLNPVATSVQQIDFELAVRIGVMQQFVDQLLVVVHRRIDKDHFASRTLWCVVLRRIYFVRRDGRVPEDR